MKQFLLAAFLFATISLFSQTTIWNGTSWNLGLPNLTMDAQIDAPYTVLSGQGFDCKTLTLTSNLQINNGGFVTFSDHLAVSPAGNLTVKSGGKLIPSQNNSTSSGTVTVERLTTPMKQYDWQCFGSPVNNVSFSSILPTSDWFNGNICQLLPENFLDENTEYNDGTIIYGVPDGQDDNGDCWNVLSTASHLSPARGYIAMSKNSGAKTMTFTGQLNTGVIIHSLHGTNSANLVSNPYSSSIFAPQFINENASVIGNTLTLWSHQGTLSSLYPGLDPLNFSLDDFAYYNELGGTASNFGGKIPSDYIGTAQGFYVRALNGGSLVFKPEFLAAGYSNSTNGVFFRSAAQSTPKIWLSIHTELGLFSQTLLAWKDAEGFTQPTSNLACKFYRVDDGGIKHKISGISEALTMSSVVKLGYFSAVQETFTINMDSTSNLEFEAFIRDNLTNTVHTLPYTFTSEAGEFNSRFELVFNNELNINEFLFRSLRLSPVPSRDYVELNIGNPDSFHYSVVDESGRLIPVKRKGKQFLLSGFASGIYYITIDDGNGSRRTLRFVKE